VVGDHPHDVELARRAGAQGVYVCTGHGWKHIAELAENEVVVPDIRAAAEWILARSRTWRPLRGGEDQIADAADTLRCGGVIAFPTETVYGLGANAFDRTAVARVFEIKNRPHYDPLIVHVADARQVRYLVRDFPAAAQTLARRFWPGPLTLVLPKTARLPDLVTAGLPTVAIRVPNHALALALLEEVGSPVAAPSANPFGMLSPTTAEHVRDQLGDRVDVILDGGPCSVGVESTIVSFCGARPTLLRPGGISAEDLEAVIGPLACPSPDEPVPLAPGRLPRHYAPRTPLRLGADGQCAPAGGRVGLLSLQKPCCADGFAAVEVLSETGDLREAAANLFAALRRLDRLGLDLILARPIPDTGLGRAILDRLRKASTSLPTDCLSDVAASFQLAPSHHTG
jgi:L-threonylcarbamoyladenylate synthase